MNCSKRTMFGATQSGYLLNIVWLVNSLILVSFSGYFWTGSYLPKVKAKYPSLALNSPPVTSIGLPSMSEHCGQDSSLLCISSWDTEYFG